MTTTVIFACDDGLDFQADIVSDFMGAHTIGLRRYDRTFGVQGDPVYVPAVEVREAASLISRQPKAKHTVDQGVGNGEAWWHVAANEDRDAVQKLGAMAQKKV